MVKAEKFKIGGWHIKLHKNARMYSHDLRVSKGKSNYQIPCEDLAIKEKTIGIWLYDSKVPELERNELKTVLTTWINQQEANFRLFITKNEYIFNKKSA